MPDRSPTPDPSKAPRFAPTNGWIVNKKRSAWKDFEVCPAGADWSEPVAEGEKVSRRKVVKIQCDHRRGTGKPARAIVRGLDDILDEVHRIALYAPCQYTQCPQWVHMHPDEVVR